MLWARVRASTFFVITTLASSSVESCSTLASFNDTCKQNNHYTAPAYLYANYVRYEQSMQIQEGENAPGSTHGLSIPCVT